MPSLPPWPLSWQRLRDDGRLQFRWLAQSSQWVAVLPEVGVQVRARNVRALIEQLTPHVNRLPRSTPPKRMNGIFPQELPAAKQLLPRR